MLLAISYTKGCYVGQETIARLKSVGHVNRTLVFLRSAGAEIAVAGTKLVVGEKEVGDGDEQRLFAAHRHRHRAGLCSDRAGRGGDGAAGGGRATHRRPAAGFKGRVVKKSGAIALLLLGLAACSHRQPQNGRPGAGK